MEFTQLKVLVFCVAVLALVGCGTASKTTEYFKPQTLQVVSMVDGAQPGDRISIPINSGLGMGTAVVDQSYVAASGRECRRLRTVDGTLIQRVACQGSDGVWSLARDLRPVSPNDLATISASAVRHTSELDQPLVPSAGSMMLLNEQNSLSSATISHDNVETLVTGAVESPMPVSAEPAIMVPADYVVPDEALPTQVSSVEALIQPSTEPVIVSPHEYVIEENVAQVEPVLGRASIAAVPAQSSAEPLIISPDEFAIEQSAAQLKPMFAPASITEAPVQSSAEPLIVIPEEFVVEENATQIEPVLAAASVAEASMLARAEALIISREEYSQQVGVELLSNGSNEYSAPGSDKPLYDRPASFGAGVSDSAGVSEIETVKRTVKDNETLWSFANRTTGNALNWESIAQINGISDAKTLASGTQLVIPATLVVQGD